MVSRRPRGRPPHPDVLTPAEWRVLGWIRHGLSRRAVADRLQISDNAVTYHVASISTKLGVAGMGELRHDIVAQLEALALAGVTAVGQPHVIHRDDAAGTEEWMAPFEDPDGNTLALMSRVPVAPA